MTISPTAPLKVLPSLYGFFAVVALSLLATVPVYANTDPQAAALARLREASRTEIGVRFQGNVARVLRMEVTATGRTLEEQARSFLETYHELFLLHGPDSYGGPDTTPQATLKTRSVGKVDGMGVVGFEQVLGGFPVFGSALLVGIDDVEASPRVVLTGAALAPPRTFNATPAFDEAMAEEFAVQVIGRVGAQALVPPELMLWEPSLFWEDHSLDGELRLAWAVVLGGDEPVQVLIDANDGGLLFQHGLSESDGGFSDYELDLEDANGGTMAGTNCFNPTTIDDFIGDEDGLISSFINDPEAVSTWWHVRHTYEFFHNSFGRHSWDHDDDEITAYVYSGHDNASYSHGCGIQFRAGWSSFDVTLHEFTHGVQRYGLFGGPVYSGLSGAVNEHLSDVFGALGDPQDWLLAEDRTNGQGAIRNLADPLNGNCGPPANPSVCNDPDHWSLRCTAANDFCDYANDNNGVHTNSNILNKAAYLLSDGGTHYGVPVQGIGRFRVGKLYYLAMSLVLPNVDFTTWRDTLLAFAQAWANTNKHGFTAQHVCAVRNAFGAVGVGGTDVNCDGIEENNTDTDGDGANNVSDNCPSISNPAQYDADQDGTGDVCDDDDDNDGCPDSIDNCPGFANVCSQYSIPVDLDNDGIGDACDPDDDNDGVPDGDDNCQWSPNPDQFDGNDDGAGDACDPDLDGDGFYIDTDNCVLIANPDQADADKDGMGDACDKCPNVSDNANAYTTGIFGTLPPQPLQPDSDGDGIPDACDGQAFFAVSLLLAALPYNPNVTPVANGQRHPVAITGPSGGRFSLPLATCSEGPYSDEERYEVRIQGPLPPVELWLRDRLGRRIEDLSAPGEETSNALRGLRFQPDCSNQYTLEGRLLGDAGGSQTTDWVFDRVPKGERNPWTSTPGSGADTPEALADADEDGILDGLDNCPALFNPEQHDRDGDGLGDVCDPCPDCGLFADGFESGDLAAWSATARRGSDGPP